MINRNEIIKLASSKKVSSFVIEKDYVLGWLLAGIYSRETLRDSFIFKGGTCLKKCFFNEYRFSEDLDFTIRKQSFLDRLLLLTEFKHVANWIYQNTGIEIDINRTEFEIYTNSKGKESCQGRVYYKGPVSPTALRQWPRIKLDLTVQEVLVDKPQKSQILHYYSDYDREYFYINSYSFNELLAEKLRAIQERCMPRDVYDVVYCIEHEPIKYNLSEVLEILKIKCNYKQINLPSIDSIEQYRQLCESAWDDQLSHQLFNLDPFEIFWNKLNGIILTLEKLK